MNKENYKRVIYFIGITIIITIAVQAFWNYREYQINKIKLIRKVQLSLDNAVESYFANITKSGIITFTSLNPENLSDKTDTIIVKTNSRSGFRKKIDSTIQNLAKNDTNKPFLVKNKRNNLYPFFTSDNHFPKNIDSLISKVMISISRDTLDLEKLNSNIIKEFDRNKIDVTYGLKYDYSNRISKDSIEEKTKEFNLQNFPEKYLTAISKSTFLPHRSHLELYFTDETAILLKQSLISILLSLLLSASIIASLIYLLKTIYRQKQLAEVKNDLISNITHEFKTPIATISTALEALKSFNALEDKLKTEKYITIANSQVNNLNIMVEKILDTASLNQEALVLSKQPLNIKKLIENVLEKYKFINSSKTIYFNNTIDEMFLNVDQFHFENALGNIVDNAIKYGGDIINIELKLVNNKIIILIRDNGDGIHKSEKDKIFDQFYRISTGNTHNVKGFGIGLYYSKSIIEKHEGTINVVYDKKNSTIFKIELLNE